MQPSISIVKLISLEVTDTVDDERLLLYVKQKNDSVNIGP